MAPESLRRPHALRKNNFFLPSVALVQLYSLDLNLSLPSGRYATQIQIRHFIHPVSGPRDHLRLTLSEFPPNLLLLNVSDPSGPSGGQGLCSVPCLQILSRPVLSSSTLTWWKQECRMFTAVIPHKELLQTNSSKERC